MGYTIDSSDKGYNGWANYETWRVHLELFNDVNVGEHFDAEPSIQELAGWANEYARDFVSNSIDDTSANGTVEGWAHAFLDSVNWRQVAEHLMDYAKDCGAFQSEEAA